MQKRVVDAMSYAELVAEAWRGDRAAAGEMLGEITKECLAYVLAYLPDHMTQRDILLLLCLTDLTENG